MTTGATLDLPAHLHGGRMAWPTRGCFVYMVIASDGSLYTGISAAPEHRILEHNASTRGAKALRGRRPVRLFRRWLCESRPAALRLEAEIKRLRAAEKWSVTLSNDSDPELAVDPE